MKTFLEAKGDTAVFTFGRFNPPTTGHEKLIDALAKQQSKNAGSLMYVYPSHSQDAKKNPLPHARKIAYMKKMFRKYARNIITSKSRNVFDIAVELHNKGHRAVVMVVGSDRVQEFDRLLNQYNGVEGKHGYYGFDDIRVVSAGERDPDAEGVEGMSASKMRAAAAQGDFDSFQMGLPRNFGDAKKLFDDIRKNMGVREQNWTDEEIMRDAYIRGEVWNVGDVVETKLGEEGTIVRKGTNYVVFENMQRVWLHDLVEEPKKITKTKQAKGDVADVKGTQPAKYYSKDADGDEMSKSTKIARARHFAKGGSRSDAPGDKDADTKPSQYTKKFKQMYGERAKQAVSQGKVQKLVTAHGLKYDGKVYKEIDMELKGIDNNTQMVTFNIIHPKEIFGKEVKIAFKALRRGPFMATDTSKINEQDDKEKPKSDQAKKRDEFDKLQKAKRVAALQYRIAKDQETVAKMSQTERKLTDAEKDKLKKYEKDIDKKDFIDRYGKEEGESIYYATLTKLAKKEGLWDNIRKKKARIAKGSGERMRKKGEKGAPTPDQIKKAQEEIEEKTTYLRRDKKLPNLKVPVRRRSDNDTLAKRIRGDKVKKYGMKEDEQLDEKIAGLVNKSEKTGVPYGILKKSYDRGMAAWKGGHRPGASQQQWAFARVNSMLTGGKADPDLQKQIKAGGYKKKKKASKESVEEWFTSDETIALYQEKYGDEYLIKLNSTYEKMLSKLTEEDCSCYDHVIEETEYQGKKVKLNDPIRTSENPKKKFKVYVKNEKGKVVVVRFGDPNMGINRDDPNARKNFRARHSCDDNPGPKWKARYWSCYQWRAGAKVDN